MKTITLTLKVNAPDDLSNAQIEHALRQILDVGQADARDTTASDEEVDAAAVAATLEIEVSAHSEASLTIIVGIEGGLVTGATAALPCTVIVADYDMVDSPDSGGALIRMPPDERGNLFLPIVHDALVDADAVKRVRSVVMGTI